MIQNVTQNPQKLFTFEDYLFYEGEPDVRYELVGGKLVPMPQPTFYHAKICDFLAYRLQRYFSEEQLNLVAKNSAVGVRTADISSRIPDVAVFDLNLWQESSDRAGSAILDFSEKPLLVVEVVSTNRRDDYLIQSSEYAIAEIPEYWIVDPKKKRVRILTHPIRDEGYTWVEFAEGETLNSPQFKTLKLSVSEIFNPPAVENLINQERSQSQQFQQQAEAERARAEKLAQKLREMGINPEEF
ncbi:MULTISPECIES: Uma2 family endonuclease [unclassified Roseofilum]|uniref:Uma2 family endonuclease n=1 Tax=unclassified Roseofilum TaxID=2620099 RepID=UPI001B08C138|nr:MULTISPECIES: Uma2 family endonuclease [unclassified Roseofilum]MBP0011114.1 Uma2 family endonuclease [Roseofilum sp. Belize Diploria]MBP0035535.1 Uma2 family endonuclease [Roseofilum sp. Belize BBD 4]